MCPVEDTLKEYLAVIDLEGIATVEDANDWVQSNYMGYIKIDGFYESEVGYFQSMFKHRIIDNKN